jgi:uncharacterized protein (DUF433 family)
LLLSTIRPSDKNFGKNQEVRDILLAGAAMPLTIHSDPSVFRLDDSDTIRIGKTRVTLATLVAVFNNGETPEQIAQDFPTLDLADIYSAMGYYLRHRDEVDAYLDDRERQAEQSLQEFYKKYPKSNGNELREKLMARRAAMVPKAS